VVEALATASMLVIVLGMMVSLARRVRAQSADGVTKDLLVRLDRLMAQYQMRNHGALPPVTPLVDPADAAPVEQALHSRAVANNRELIRCLRASVGDTAKELQGLPVSIYDKVNLRDAWGNPIVFMPTMHPAIGMALGGKCFFVSAGPDGRFLTRADDLYSYEIPDQADR
jgi:hypothetical protein